MFGITKNRVETIRKALAETGHPPKDGRGKHNNRPHKLTADVRQAIQDHISSFRGRVSHYARGATRRLYLSEELNITKMYDLFKERHPEVTVGYESYRSIFNSDFNIGFGYPPTADDRNNWNGAFESVALKKTGKGSKQSRVTLPLEPSHCAPIPITSAKYKDLQGLKKLCKSECQSFFDNLPTQDGQADTADSESEVTDSDE
ncbi:hypothetical protein EGW08_008635 [Elysia chlorotica]|uniref:Uncharacterized protein n=1 Tax=Elysia chlorotica TaxID=188477 RepID=A0A3S0ZV41_ELYCH|nr:hypothetical protein EGW08_008635 [Elysia chlorotica]